MPKNNTIIYRVGQLEKETCNMESKLDEILTNHLPHIHEKLATLETRVLMFTTINIGAIIVSILIQRLL